MIDGPMQSIQENIVGTGETLYNRVRGCGVGIGQKVLDLIALVTY